MLIFSMFAFCFNMGYEFILTWNYILQKQPPEVFTGKHVCQSVFFNKFAGLRAATLLKKKLRHSCFPANLVKVLRTTYLQNTSARLLLILYVASFLYFTLSKIFASKKVASCEKSQLVENRLNGRLKEWHLFAENKRS